MSRPEACTYDSAFRRPHDAQASSRRRRRRPRINRPTAGAGQSAGDLRQLAADHRRAARHGRGRASARGGSRDADPQGGRQRDRRRDRDLGGAGRSRAGHDRPRRRHVRPLLRGKDREGPFHQRHRLRRAGRHDRLLQIQGRHPRRRPAVDRGAGRGRRRRLRGEDLRDEDARRCPRAGDRDRRRRLPGLGSAGRRHQERESQDREISLDDEDLFQGRQAARDGRRHPQSRSGTNAARDRGAGPGRVLPRRRREEHRGVPQGERRHHQRGGSRELSAVRGCADSRELPRRRGLRVPAQLAGLRDARGAQHPRGLQAEGDGAQQRAVPARDHRGAEAVVRRSQRLCRRPEVRPEHPDAGAALEGVRRGAALADRSEPRHRRRAGARRSARHEGDRGRSRRASTATRHRSRCPPT